MFGYVRPVLDRLDKEQRETYQSAYCGLCHALGERHGWLARLTLQYDFTFLAIVLTAGDAKTNPCAVAVRFTRFAGAVPVFREGKLLLPQIKA